MDYRSAGVDIEQGRAFVDAIRSHVQRTHRPGVVGGLGGFGGVFAIPPGYREPLLVAGTDGVGTKLKLAQICDQHDTVGIDLVAMCVNDVLTSGAEPLFFLDYIATGKLEPAQLVQVVAGIATGCEHAGCALLGGETAEMPGFYAPQAYDLAGFCVGIVERAALLDGQAVQVGDRLWGLPSSGVHSNGLSLVRRIVTDSGLGWQHQPTGWATSLGQTFLTPTTIYVKPILAALQAGLPIHAMAHITGGGLPENLPRCLGADQAAQIDPLAWVIPEMFQWLAQHGDVSRLEMFNTFNMGIGMVLATAADAPVPDYFPEAIAIGEVVPGAGELLGLA